MISSPALKDLKTQSVAARPDENANPRVPFSILAKASSKAVRVGFEALLYS
ncbi:hypothetical protein D3C80_1206700 [compost metagenome]